MSKIGIVGHGVPNTMLLVAESIDNKITEEQLNELSVIAKCSVDQIEVVPQEEFAKRSKELGQTYIFTPLPAVPSIPYTIVEDPLFTEKKRKLRTYTESDSICYNKKILKRRKKNKNKKTHRK